MPGEDLDFDHYITGWVNWGHGSNPIKLQSRPSYPLVNTWFSSPKKWNWNGLGGIKPTYPTNKNHVIWNRVFAPTSTASNRGLMDRINQWMKGNLVTFSSAGIEGILMHFDNFDYAEGRILCDSRQRWTLTLHLDGGPHLNGSQGPQLGRVWVLGQPDLGLNCKQVNPNLRRTSSFYIKSRLNFIRRTKAQWLGILLWPICPDFNSWPVPLTRCLWFSLPCIQAFLSLFVLEFHPTLVLAITPQKKEYDFIHGTKAGLSWWVNMVRPRF